MPSTFSLNLAKFGHFSPRRFIIILRCCGTRSCPSIHVNVPVKALQLPVRQVTTTGSTGHKNQRALHSLFRPWVYLSSLWLRWDQSICVSFYSQIPLIRACLSFGLEVTSLLGCSMSPIFTFLCFAQYWFRTCLKFPDLRSQQAIMLVHSTSRTSPPSFLRTSVPKYGRGGLKLDFVKI